MICAITAIRAQIINKILFVRIKPFKFQLEIAKEFEVGYFIQFIQLEIGRSQVSKAWDQGQCPFGNIVYYSDYLTHDLPIILMWSRRSSQCQCHF